MAGTLASCWRLAAGSIRFLRQLQLLCMTPATQPKWQMLAALHDLRQRGSLAEQGGSWLTAVCTLKHMNSWSTVCCWACHLPHSVLWAALASSCSLHRCRRLHASDCRLQHHACGLQVGASDNLDSQATALTQKYIKMADPCTFRLIAKNVVNILPVNKKQLKEDTYKELDELIR